MNMIFDTIEDAANDWNYTAGRVWDPNAGRVDQEWITIFDETYLRLAQSTNYLAKKIKLARKMVDEQATFMEKSQDAERLPMKLVTEQTSRRMALVECRQTTTATEIWLGKAREFYQLQPVGNEERGTIELTGAMNQVGVDYDYANIVNNINQDHIRVYRTLWEPNPMLTMRTIDMICEVEDRNYGIFDRVHQFRDRDEDVGRERPRPLPDR